MSLSLLQRPTRDFKKIIMALNKSLINTSTSFRRSFKKSSSPSDVTSFWKKRQKLITIRYMTHLKSKLLKTFFPLWIKSTVHNMSSWQNCAVIWNKLLLLLLLFTVSFSTFGFFALALAANNILFIDFGLTVGFLTFYKRVE